MKLTSKKKLVFIKYLLLKCSERIQSYTKLLENLSKLLKSNNKQLKINQDQITSLEKMLDNILTNPDYYQADKHERLLGYHYKLSNDQKQLLSINEQINKDYMSNQQVLSKELHIKTKLNEKLSNYMRDARAYLEFKDTEENLELYITQSFYVSE
ncbi:hypothetical protein [Zooshikella harenae]|uniref:Flagellar FliJ protein n=1 Tax=Zooshikella harenae TaxID=2827238 RepID=A0ABS5ZD29_9GAMM|nr:hypothetical protein [Zooshikella harenae]MBU2711663.1 hypothetical protein [Zooshikella harenae]